MKTHYKSTEQNTHSTSKTLETKTIQKTNKRTQHKTKPATKTQQLKKQTNN